MPSSLARARFTSSWSTTRRGGWAVGRGGPARTLDERTYGLVRGARTGVARMQQICENHRRLLRDHVSFAAAGHSIDIIVGNHDIELMEPEVAAELERQLRMVGREGVERIR